MGAPLKELVIAHIGAIARSDSVLLLHATIFFGAWNNFWQLGVHGRWSQIDCSMVSGMQMLANKCNKNKLF